MARKKYEKIESQAFFLRVTKLHKGWNAVVNQVQSSDLGRKGVGFLFFWWVVFPCAWSFGGNPRCFFPRTTVPPSWGNADASGTWWSQQSWATNTCCGYPQLKNIEKPKRQALAKWFANCAAVPGLWLSSNVAALKFSKPDTWLLRRGDGREVVWSSTRGCKMLSVWRCSCKYFWMLLSKAANVRSLFFPARFQHELCIPKKSIPSHSQQHRCQQLRSALTECGVDTLGTSWDIIVATWQSLKKEDDRIGPFFFWLGYQSSSLSLKADNKLTVTLQGFFFCC